MSIIEIRSNQKKYSVKIGGGILTGLLTELSRVNQYGNYFVVIDSYVNKLYREKIHTVFENTDKAGFMIFPASESNKTFDGVQKIISNLLKKKFSRDTLLIAIGGGITGDAAGFAASIYMRGIPYVHVPTTLLAAVDSSIGGKTGVNFAGFKNIAGSFYQPEFVLIDTDFFKSLPENELLCGAGEIVKYAFLTDDDFYKFIMKHIGGISKLESKVLNRVVSRCVQFKGSVVEADEKEVGMRKILNFGHTFAHAFESASNHKLKHGQAVIVGIVCANYLSSRLGVIDKKLFDDRMEFLSGFFNRIKLKKISPNELFSAMKKDKKNRDETVRFVLVRNIGEILLDVTADRKDILWAANNGMEHFIGLKK